MKKEYLINNTKLTFIGTIISKIINFILISIYTNNLSTTQYGTIDILNSYGVVLITLISIDTTSSITRFSLDKNINKNEIISIGTLIFIISSLIYILLFPLLNKIELIKTYTITIILYLITITLFKFLMGYLKGNENLKLYSKMTILQSILIALINIIFIKIKHFGINEYIITHVISNIIISLIIIIKEKIIKKITLKINKQLLKQMIKYSSFYVPSSFLDLIIYSFDKMMIIYFIGMSSNGIYSVSNKIPYIIVCISNIFTDSWMLSTVKENKTKEKEEFANKVLTLFIEISIIAISFIILTIKFIMKIYVSEEFFISWMYTIPLLIGGIFLFVSTFIANEYIVNKDSKNYFLSAIFGAIITIILNIILIPLLGLMGAAIANCLRSLSILLYRYKYTKKYLKLNIITKKTIISIILLITLSIFIYINSYISNIIKILIFIIIIYINKNSLKLIKKEIINRIKINNLI